MTRFRFVTGSRIGKWYSDLRLAQRSANSIGAGYFDEGSGDFVAYRGTVLEIADDESALARKRSHSTNS